MFQAEQTETEWKPLYRLGGAAALILVAIIPIAVIAFIALPPPSFQPTSSAVIDWFTIYAGNPLRGLLDGDLLMVVAEVLQVPLLLALYVGLRKVNPSFMPVALALGLIGVAAYVTSNPAFSLLSLSGQYAATTDPALRSQLVAAGQALLGIYQGTPYDVGYLLGGVAILMIGIVMLQSPLFGRRTAYVGIVTGLLSLVPATAGTIGLIFSFVSLIPTVIWEILLARRFLQLGRA